ncbi:glycosyltransferase family 2 protein [Candidatus Latescibacterota bacterium]
MERLISVIMPAYNEGSCIFENIRTTIDVLNEAGLKSEIIAIDDGSSDNTLSEINRAAATFDHVIAVSNPRNMGKGMALKNGFGKSSGEIVVFMDADLDLHPSQINNLIAKLDSGDCDVVVTSKHHPESKLSYPFSRKIVSYVYYLIIKILFNLPVRDTQTGLKIFRREVLENAFHRMLVKTYAYDVELLAISVRFGFGIKEIPVVLDFKRGMKWGRIRLKDVIEIFLDTLAIFYRLKILKYYDKKH